MTVKFSDILNADKAFGKLSEERLPVKQSVGLARLVKKLNSEMEIFNEQREMLLSRYGEYKAEMGGYEIPKENLEAFRKDFNTLLDSEVELEGERLKIVLPEESTIEAAVILGCEKFCEFEEVE